MDKIDMILLMSVNPGFGGQKFIPETLHKLTLARARIDAYYEKTGRQIWLEVDGGVNAMNIADIARAGADTFVAGSAIFSSPKDTDKNRYNTVVGEMRAALATVK
jgi:ribulose-phosphate 3-epimerase